ncbi:MAG: guanylate kinase [Pseudobdellovibrionaceae bacterium]|jgi:guanylate kinase
MKTKMIIVAAPSGAGKSSFVEKICQENSRLEDTITYTTRSMRAGESQKKPYYFISKEEFQRLVEKAFFVEWAVVHNNLYGTPLEQLENAWAKGKTIIMDVDVQGAETFKRKYPDAVSVFILPPSIDELRRRIVKRDGKTPADLEVRMQNAEKELALAHLFDYRIVNDEFDKSFQQFKKIVEELIG